MVCRSGAACTAAELPLGYSTMKPRKDKTGGSNLVFSTDPRICPGCLRAQPQCICDRRHNTLASDGDGIVRLHRETKGRKGRSITSIRGLTLNEPELLQLAKQLKTACGVGGNVKGGIVELQTADREKVRDLIQRAGFKVKIAGG